MSIRVVLADDHPLTRAGIMAYLAKENDFDVVGEFSDGDAALAGIEALHPDVALLDIRMPGADGVAICRHMKETRSPTICLMLTNYDSQEYVLAAQRAGARGYVLKTSPADTLARAIRIAAKGGMYLDNEIASAIDADPKESTVDPITARERAVLVPSAKGLSSREIADGLFISERTVQTHLASIYEKLGARNKTEAVIFALKYGIITLDELVG
ncbi:DNA-binding response regulator [Synergistales bacterium]|nr:DNA-binding response regulator [Synergistales bacterium]